MTFVQRENEIHFVCEEALNDYGYVLKWNGTECTVNKANITEYPLGVCMTSTRDFSNPVLTYLADKEVNIKREGVCDVKLVANNALIHCGDYVCTTGVINTVSSGTVDLWVPNTLTAGQYHRSISTIVGIALEEVAAGVPATGDTDKIRVLLTIRNL